MRDILIVEDGLHERERLEKLFLSAKYSVATAESAQEAEKLIKREQFRLAFLDINLGDKSGSYLFDLMRRAHQIPYIIVLTGNPSVHLKNRFIEEGATAYIVKASPGSENESLLERVRSLLGSSDVETIQGMPLLDFIKLYLPKNSAELFLDSHGDTPTCGNCGHREYIVSFAHKTQLPPQVEGRVVCASCGKEMDPQVG